MLILKKCFTRSKISRLRLGISSEFHPWIFLGISLNLIKHCYSFIKRYLCTCGLLALYSSQSRLCSRTKSVWSAIKPGCSLARESPAATRRLASRPTGLSFDTASVFACLRNTKMNDNMMFVQLTFSMSNSNKTNSNLLESHYYAWFSLLPQRFDKRDDV